MRACLGQVSAILGGLGAAIAPAASIAGAAPVVVTAAVGLPLVAALVSSGDLMSTIRGRNKSDCKTLLDAARIRVMAAWEREDIASRFEQAERDRLSHALAAILPKCLPDDETGLRRLLATEGLDGTAIAAALLDRAPPHDPDGTFAQEGPQHFFRDVVATAWEALRTEPTFYATLQSYVDERHFTMLENIEVAVIDGFARMDAKLDTLHDDI